MISHLTTYAFTDIVTIMAKNTDLAERIRNAAKASGLSRFELAKRAGVSYSIVHRFMLGERDIRLSTASKLCNVLGLDLAGRR